MKKVMLVLMVVMVSVLTACGDKKKKAPIAHAERIQRAPGDLSQTTDVALNGQVFQDGDYDFTDAVKGLTNASVPEDYVGFVNGDFNATDNRTGVLFGGRVQAESGKIIPGSSQPRVNITGSSRLLVVVYDEFAGQKDENGQTIPAIPIHLTTASGYIEGNRAYLKFWDSYGSIVLEGTFQSNGDFVGKFIYDNQKKYDGSGLGGEGQLGTFFIRACSFFVCN